MLESIEAGSKKSLSDAEKDAIKAHLERLLLSVHFSHSRRFPAFLRFVVGAFLDGRGELLKERTIGIEVFGRDADYDTTSDPIVRVTAAEIRKRIAQFYQATGSNETLRLSLPSGSYVPQFHWLDREGEISTLHAPDLEPLLVEESTPKPHYRFLMVLALASLFVIVACLSVAGWWYWGQSRVSFLDRFWAPVLTSKEPVLFCVADQEYLSAIKLRDAADTSKQTLLTDTLSVVVMDDVTSLVHIAGLMDAHGRAYRLKGEGTTTLTDLREGPTVFVGAYDNAWTLRLTNPLRYHFRNSPDMTHYWIEDRQDPNKIQWALDRKQQGTTNSYRDYGIVGRFTDGNTGKVAIIAAGIAKGATIAAGEFLTESSNMEALAAKAPRHWDGKNIEVVISTEVIDGHSAPPKVEAAYFW